MWDRKSLLSASQFSRADVEEMISLASRFKQKTERLCNGKILANIFFEPSTRTEKSFQAAMYRLGGNVISHKDAGSSREKGETKNDTIRILSSYADIAVIRDSEEGKTQEYADIAGIPVINAGDGGNEHPSQMLLDAFTIKENVGRLDDLKVLFVGDMRHSRTIRSLIKILSKFRNNAMYGVHIGDSGISGDIEKLVKKVSPVSSLRGMIEELSPDVVYCNRIQKERLKGETASSYMIDGGVVEIMPENCILMDPLPRVGNMDPRIDSDSRAAYFKQAANGVPMRMAIIAEMLKAK